MEDYKHNKWFACVLLILGILFLLQDFEVWNFWNISWYSALLVLFGLGHVFGCCKVKK